MSIWEAIVLGILQGLTEFLPVSSSGHLELGKRLLGIAIQDDLLFSVILHAATALSTIIIFRKDILAIIGDIFRWEWNESTQFSLKIIISMIPVGVVGLLFEEKIEAFFDGKLLLVGAMLLLTGVLLLISEVFSVRRGSEVGFGQAFVIGLAQAVAILPGISRSGATIATGLLLGVDKSKVARFSFLMVLLPILGASLLKFLKYLKNPTDLDIAVISAGFVAAFVVGLLACQAMLALVRGGKLYVFAIYCFVVGGIAIYSEIF